MLSHLFVLEFRLDRNLEILEMNYLVPAGSSFWTVGTVSQVLLLL
jgi:hypothetical protein